MKEISDNLKYYARVSLGADKTQRGDVDRHKPVLAAADLIADMLPVVQRTVALRLNGRKMYENVGTFAAFNEAEAFERIKPFYFADNNHKVHS